MKGSFSRREHDRNADSEGVGPDLLLVEASALQLEIWSPTGPLRAALSRRACRPVGLEKRRG